MFSISHVEAIECHGSVYEKVEISLLPVVPLAGRFAKAETAKSINHYTRFHFIKTQFTVTMTTFVDLFKAIP